MILEKYDNYIFDLDNTLIECYQHYIERKVQFSKLASERTGLSQEFCLKVLDELDMASTTLTNAFGIDRFPTSFKAASLACDAISGTPICEFHANEMFMLGKGVFYDEYPLYPDTIAVLDKLKNSGKRMALLTKGDYTIQMNKILKNKLHTYFPHNHIYIVPRKTPKEVQTLIDDLKMDVSKTVFIGDSMKDDMFSAQSIGIDTVHVKGNHGFIWKYDEINGVSPTYTIESVSDLK